MENLFCDLDSPVERLCGVEVLIPYPSHLEEASVPQKNDIVNAQKNIGSWLNFSCLVWALIWKRGRDIGCRSVLHATLSGDHRATDGLTGSRFLTVLNKHLQNPETL